MQRETWGQSKWRVKESLLHLCSVFLGLAETSVPLFLDTRGARTAGHQNQPDKGRRKDGSVSSGGDNDDSSASFPGLTKKVFALSTTTSRQLEDTPRSESNATNSLVTKDEAEEKQGEAKEKESRELISFVIPFPEGMETATVEEHEHFPDPPPSRPPLTSAIPAASESKLKTNLGCWAKSSGLESQIEYLGILTAGICTVASVRPSVGEVSFLKESRAHPRSVGWWKFRFSFGKCCCTEQQRPVPRTARKSELKLHSRGHEIFTGWQQHTFQNGSLLDLALLREAVSYLYGCGCGPTPWDQLHLKYQKKRNSPIPKIWSSNDEKPR